MSKLLSIGIFIASLFVCSTTFGDTLQLKNGVVLEGTILEETENSVTFGVEGGSVKFNRSEIARIEKNDLGKEFLKIKAVTLLQPVKKSLGNSTQGDILERIRKFVDSPTQANFITPEGFKPERIVPTLIRLVIAFFFTAFVIMVYGRFSGQGVTYGFAIWFLFRYNLLTNIVVLAGGLIGGMISNPPAGQTGVILQVNIIPILIGILFSIWYFFYFAKREFEFGFLKSLGLLLVAGIANMVPGIIMAALGYI